MNSHEKKDRRLEIASKLIRMGQALAQEGKDNDDFTVSQVGYLVNFLAGLIYEEKDVADFSHFCTMFSGKKILDDMMENIPEIRQYIEGRGKGISYDDIIKDIERLRDKNREDINEDDDDDE